MKIFKIHIVLILLSILIINSSCTMAQDQKYNKLNKEEERVIINKGTEPAFTGQYTDFYEEGTYLCKRCGTELFKSKDKFTSNCGWPSFDDEIEGKVKRQKDKDGIRTEIVCANCGAHLGHVFEGEAFTDKNTRHCVNSISLNFAPAESQKLEKAVFAGGCFWGVEFYMEKIDGVKSVISGYTGGKTKNPSYEEVCSGKTGHYEAVQITYDPVKVSFEQIAKTFFEIHDPTQHKGQGPDIGQQYESVVFYFNDEQKKITQKLIDILEEKGYSIATKLLPAVKFYTAENYHQDYYNKKGTKPYCHGYSKRF